MSTEKEKAKALVPAQSAALSKAGTRSLAARGRTDLRNREDADKWLIRGIEHKRAGEFEQALACYLRGIEADPGNSFLQEAIGGAYYVSTAWADVAKAMYSYGKAAEQGHAVAQCLLAYEYEGYGIPPDLEQSVYWYRQSAKQGHRPAVCQLSGADRISDALLPVNPGELDFWRREREKWDGATNESILAPLDPDGVGVPDSLEKALDWYRKAVEKGDGRVQQVLWEDYFG